MNGFKLLFSLLIVFNFAYSISSQQLNKDTDCKCRIPAAGRIVGGQEVKSTIAWQASLQKTDFGHFCGATILNRNWIMSAAHCIIDINTPEELAKLRVVVGIHKLDQTNSTNSRTVQRILYDKRYDPNNATTIGDISLLQLTEPLDLSDSVQPACLPQQDEEYDTLRAIGWGSIKTLTRTPLGQTKGVLSNVLKEAYFNQDHQIVPGCDSYLVCLSPKAKGDSICAGDSGGGLQHDKNGITRVVGIAQFVTGIKTSPFSVKFCYGPSAYQRVAPLVPIIKSVIGDDYCSKN